MNDTDLSTAMSATGLVEWELSENGQVVAHGANHNLVTQVGDQMYMERALGITGAPAAPLGMRLGIGSTTPAKSGTGAALSSYLNDSSQAFDSGYPASSLNLGARRLTYKVTYAAGKATTSSPITEVVIVNDALSNATSTSANTIARALISGVPAKSASQTLTVTWSHDLMGS